MVLEWLPIEGAKSYKVLYDEESLLNMNAPDPILESVKIETTRMEIKKIMEGTAYYIVVHGFDDTGKKVGQTIPLHASTLRSPIFNLQESIIVDDQNISLIFSRPIDLKNTQIEIVNSETKKPRATKAIISSLDDLRIVQIQLEGKMAPDMSHDIVLKKVTDISGLELSPEAKKTATIVFSSPDKPAQIPAVVVENVVLPVVKTETPPVLKEEKKVETAVITETPIKYNLTQESVQPDAALDLLKQKADELGIERVEASLPIDSLDNEKTLVAIDQLPKTGMSTFFLLGIALGL
jgi:hypothetical protein